MIDGSITNRNKVKCVLFLDRKFYVEVGKEAAARAVSKSSIVREKLAKGAAK